MRPLLSVWRLMCAVVVLVGLAPPADAGCNVVPSKAISFNADLGATNRPYAGPNESLEITVRSCDASPGVGASASEHLVTVLFTPPGGPTNAVVLTAASDCAALAAKLAACDAQLGGGTTSCVAAPASGLQVMERKDLRSLAFRFPDSAALPGGPFAGAAAIAVSGAGDPLPCGVATTGCSSASGLVACVDRYYATDRACGTAVAHPTFPHFTALPQPNDYQADCFGEAPPCTASASAVRYTFDSAGNMLIPVNWTGVLLPSTVPVPRLLDVSFRSPFPFSIPDQVFLGSFTPEGALLPPIFEPKLKPGNLVPDTVDISGSVDAPYTILRIAHRHGTCAGGENAGQRCSTTADCDGAPCPLSCRGDPAIACTGNADCGADGPCGELYDATLVASASPLELPRSQASPWPGICQEDSSVSCPDMSCASGPCVNYAFQANSPVDISSLALRSSELRTFSVIEPLGLKDENGDHDSGDRVAVLRNRITGLTQPLGADPLCGITGTPTGRAVASTSSAVGFDVPAIAVEGDLMAMLESEPAENFCELNGDGDRADAVLRAFRLGDGERQDPALPRVTVDGGAVLDGAAVAISDGLVFTRRSEAAQSKKVTELVSTDDGFNKRRAEIPRLSGDGRYVLMRDIPSVQGVVPKLYMRDRCVVKGRSVAGCTPSNEDVATGVPSTADYGFSRDGRWVVFTSGTANLVPGDTNGKLDVFVKDRCIAEGVAVPGCIPSLERASVAGAPPSIVEADAASNVDDNGLPRSARRMISDDGRYVAFDSMATNLDGGDPFVNDVFVRDRCVSNGTAVAGCTPATHRVSGFAPQPGADARRPSISGDGRLVAYDACLDVTNCNPQDVYVRDRCTGAPEDCTPTTRLVSYGIPGNPLPGGRSSDPALSRDGRYVCFQTAASNITRASGIIVRDLQTGLAENADLGYNGQPAFNGQLCDISADGRFVAFQSRALGQDSPADLTDRPQYVRDRATGLTELVPRSSTGTPGRSCCQSTTVDYYPPSISDDGTVVAFGSSFPDLVYVDDGINADTLPQAFVRGLDPAPANVAASDLDGDGELDDRPLLVLDARAAAPTSETLCPTDAAAVAGGAVAYLRRESSGGTGSCAKGSLNADDDTSDAVLQLWKPGPGPRVPGSSQNLRCAATAVSLSDTWVGARVSEAGEGHDLNRDGDVSDDVAAFRAVDAPAANSCSGDASWAFTGQAADTVQVSASIGIVITPETAQGKSLNGDADTADRVLQVYKLNGRKATRVRCVADDHATCTSGVRLAVDDVVPGEPANSSCGPVHLIAFRVDEAAQGVNLNGPNTCSGGANAFGLCDGDAECPGGTCVPGDADRSDHVLHVLDTVTGELINTGMAAVPCTFDACDARQPYRVDGSVVKFLSLESDQNGLDLDGNGTGNGLVVQSFDFCASRNTTIGGVNPTAPGQAPTHEGEAFTTAAGRCALSSPSSCNGNSACNADATAFCDLDTCNDETNKCRFRESVSCAVDADCRRCILRQPSSCNTSNDCPGGSLCVPTRVTVPVAIADQDRDGVADDVDNCPDVSNPSQLDLDGNQIGDACEGSATGLSCSPTIVPTCVVAATGQLLVDERTAGKERLGLQWKQLGSATTATGFGDPVSGALGVAACLYRDDGMLVQGYVVDRGGHSCSGKPCWKAKSDTGWTYVDARTAADGIAKIGFASGAAGKGTVSAQGRNVASKGQTSLATGIAAALVGQTHPTIQLVTSNGFCVGATLNDVTKDDGVQFKAKKD